MSLENMIAETQTAGQDTAPAPDASTDLETRFAGITDPDAAEPEETPADLPAEGEEAPEETASQEPDPFDGYEDFDLDGEVLKIPAKAKDYLLRQADYTRKTQEVAEQRKQLQAKEQELVQRYQQTDQELNVRVALTNIGEQLKEYEGINWAEEARKVSEDVVAQTELNSRYMRFQELRGQAQQALGYLNQAQQQRMNEAQQNAAKRLQDTVQYAQTKIKGWTPQLDTDLTNWAVNDLGFSPDTLKDAYTPQIYQLLHDAFQWNQTLKRQSTARPSNPSPPVAKTQTVSAKANPSGTPVPKTMEDYVRLRAAGKL